MRCIFTSLLSPHISTYIYIHTYWCVYLLAYVLSRCMHWFGVGGVSLTAFSHRSAILGNRTQQLRLSEFCSSPVGRTTCKNRFGFKARYLYPKPLNLSPKLKRKLQTFTLDFETAPKQLQNALCHKSQTLDPSQRFRLGVLHRPLVVGGWCHAFVLGHRSLASS